MFCVFIGRPCACRARHPGRSRQRVGGEAVLLVPGQVEPLPRHGVHPWGRPHEPAHQEGHLRRAHGSLLHCRDDTRYRECPRIGLHSQVRRLITLL